MIDANPSEESYGNNLWDYEVKTPGNLRTVCLHRPDAHPLWQYYIVGLVHLRDIEGSPEPRKEHPDSTHEVLCMAYNPEFTPNPPDPDSLRYLKPLNLVHQLRGLTDEQARQVFSQYLHALADRRLSPDTDYTTAQKYALDSLSTIARNAN